MTSRFRWRLLSGALLSASVVSLAIPVAAHTEAAPRRITPGGQVRLVITATPEREPFRNQGLQVIIPRQFEPLTCDGPDGWACTVDRQSFAPHVLVVWDAVAPPVPDALEFGVTTLVPTQEGAYLLRALQEHADGYIEPWVYNGEPFPSAFVIVGEDTTIVNPDGSAEDPPCFGPSYQPSSYEAHDGRAVEDGCDPSQPAPPPGGPQPSASPTPEPSSSAPPPRPTPGTSTGPSASSAPTSDPSPDVDPSPADQPPSDPSSSVDPSAPTTTDRPSQQPGDRPSAPAISIEDTDRPRDFGDNGLPVAQLAAGLLGVAALGYGLWRRRT